MMLIKATQVHHQEISSIFPIQANKQHIRKLTKQRQHWFEEGSNQISRGSSKYSSKSEEIRKHLSFYTTSHLGTYRRICSVNHRTSVSVFTVMPAGPQLGNQSDFGFDGYAGPFLKTVENTGKTINSVHVFSFRIH